MKITFRPVELSDLPMIRSWIALPHWQEWWGDPDEEVAKIAAKFTGEDTTEPFLFCIGGVPTGYIQYWFARDEKRTGSRVSSPWLMDLDDETVGVDMAIGEAVDVGKGIGTKVLRAFVNELLSKGFTKIIIDPDIKNKRAISAYEKAGFVPIKEVKAGKDTVLLMRWEGTQTT